MAMESNGEATTESSELLSVAESKGEAEITLEGADCRVTIRGPEYPEDPSRWPEALPAVLALWERMAERAHQIRMAEIKAEHGGRVGPASAGFMQEGASEARNQTLAGGTGARP